MDNEFIIDNVKIFTGEEVIESGYVHVKNGIIEDVGSHAPAATDGVARKSQPGHTIFPGLIDAHIHASGGNELALTQSLEFGVTTVLDMLSDPEYVSKLKDFARSRTDAADFYSACLGATTATGWPRPALEGLDLSPEVHAEASKWPSLTSPAEAAAFVAANAAAGASYIKLFHESGAAMGRSFATPTPELQAALVAAAHAAGLPAVAHATSLPDTLAVLAAGVDGLVHTFFDQPPTAALVAAYRARGAWCCPTLVVVASFAAAGREDAQRMAADARVAARLPPAERTKLCRCMALAVPGSPASLEHAFESVRALHAAGVDVLCGTDSAAPALGTTWGASMHQELQLLVDKCGFAPREALRAATAVTARRFGLADRGVLAKGMRADMVLVEGDAVADITATLNLKGVWRGGARLDGQRL